MDSQVKVGVAAIVDDYGKTLLLQRASDQKWVCPGGKIEFGESAEEAVIRELKEETGLEGTPLFEAGVGHHVDRETNISWITIYYLVDVKQPREARIMEPDKHIALQFWDLEELSQDEYGYPSEREIIEV